MNERTMRAVVGLSFIAEHFILLILVAVLTIADKFTADELFTTFGIIGPLFAAYTTASVKKLLTQIPERHLEPVAWERSVLSFTVPIFYFVAVVAIIFWKALGSLTFDAFVKLIGVAETFVGVYVGMVVENLFGSPKSRKA